MDSLIFRIAYDVILACCFFLKKPSYMILLLVMECVLEGGGGVVNIDIVAVLGPAVYTLSPSYIRE